MSNKWGIPKEVEKFVIERDLFCVYCRVDFSINHESRRTKPTWEHIINDITMSTVENIALCCTSCNASKGAKLLLNWLSSTYCINKKINERTVSDVVKNSIMNIKN